MSKISSMSLTNNCKDIIPIPPNYMHSTRNFQINSKKSESSKSKERKENYKAKFTYIPKGHYDLNNLIEGVNPNHTVNLSRENIKDIKKEKEKEKSVNYSNNTEKRNDIISIFDARKIMTKNNNNDKTPNSNNNNFVFISNNSRKNSKSNIFISGKSGKMIPKRYQLNLNNPNNSNNSILIGNKINPENKGRIIRIGDKYKRLIEKDKGRIITIEDISINNNKCKILKKCLSKPNYVKDNTFSNCRITNSTNGEYSETFNSEKIKKHRSIKSNCKNNNLYSSQAQATPRDINYNNKTSIQSYTINIKNNSQIFDSKNIIIPNYLREIKIRRKSNYNVKEFMEKEKRINSSNIKNKKLSGETKMKNQVNNNNININNVYINLDNKSKDFFNNSNEYRQLMQDDINQLNKKSFPNLYNKSSSNKDLSIKNDQIQNSIKQMWKKIGGVTENYKKNFIEKLNYLNADDKFYFFIKEREEIDILLNILEKLNKNIKIRNNINSKLKNINANNCPKKEEISKLLISLRMITINIINDFINFKKEISYDIVNNKYNITSINNYPYHYLFQIENDTNYLYYHEYLSNIYKFSKYPDPFLLNLSKESKDNKKYIILPLNDLTLQEIQKANYFLLKEKMNKDERKRSIVKSPSNFCNNAILIRNNNIVKKPSEKKLKNIKNKFDNFAICSEINVFNVENSNKIKNETENKIKDFIVDKNSMIEIINNNVKIFKNVDIFQMINNFEITKNDVKEKDKYICCSKAADLQILNNNFIKKYINITFSNNINFDIKNYPKAHPIFKFSKNIIPCSKIANIEIKINNIKPTNNITNTNNNLNDNIQSLKNNQTNPQVNNNNQKGEAPPQSIPPQPIHRMSDFNQVVVPFDSKAYPPIELIYNAYLKTVNNDIKISFKINPDIYHYSSIGVSPKIVLFKQNNSILYGIATLSYDPSQIYHRALMITSISCSNNYSICNTLLQLVDYCDREIEYDELILYLYFYENEEKKGEYLLNEEFKNMIKTKTKFKWTALENSGNERKIKYHYKKSFSSKNNLYIPNNNIIKIVKNYTQIRFYRLIRYNQTKCEKGLNAKEYTFLFNVLDLIVKYGKEPNNNEDELNQIFGKISGLKKKRLLKMITEFNFVIYNQASAFVEELSKIEDKKFSLILFKRFLPLFKNITKNQFLGLYYTDISANFSKIFKKNINGYEYNIISVNEFNIEVFRLSNEQNNVDYNNFLYFFKSENESISFILYELDSINEKEIEIENNINKNYKNDLFNKILKRILTKDNEEPAKYYKKIGIPSFRYHPNFEIEKNEYNLCDYDILDGDDWFDFCIENNNNANLFSFPEHNVVNEDVKIIENSFIVAIINPDLTVDYHIPALNIYYINKNCWIKR